MLLKTGFVAFELDIFLLWACQSDSSLLNGNNAQCLRIVVTMNAINVAKQHGDLHYVGLLRCFSIFHNFASFIYLCVALFFSNNVVSVTNNISYLPMKIPLLQMFPQIKLVWPSQILAGINTKTIRLD